MRLKNILIVVNDLENSIDFYRTLFGLQVTLHRDGNVMMTEGLVLQDASVWKEAIAQELIPYNHTTELYFEEPDLEGFVKKLETYKEPVKYVTLLTEYPWGQKVLRIYDPDGNLIEVRTPN